MNLVQYFRISVFLVLVDAVSVTTMEPCGNFAFVAQKLIILNFTRGHRPLCDSTVDIRAKLE